MAEIYAPVVIEVSLSSGATVEVELSASPTIEAQIASTGPQGERGPQGIPGQDGAPGADGQDGEDGVSPEVTVTEITGGHTVTITDAEHPSGQRFNVMDGEDGEDGTDGTDGVSPGVTINEITGGHTVTITDAAHPEGQTFTVTDGEDGAPGEDGEDGVGVPEGGTTGQVLRKRSAADYDTEWGEGGSQDIFFCTTSTTAAEITAALSAGKLPVLVYGTGRFVYTNTAAGNNYYFFSRCQDNVVTTISIYIPDSTWSVPGTATMAYASTVSNHIGDTAAHVTAADKTEWNGKQDAISDLETIRSGAALGATALQSVPAHAASHAAGGSDQITPASIGAAYPPVLLWTNASQTSSFSAQTISIALSGYKYLMIMAKTRTSWGTYNFSLYRICGLTAVLTSHDRNTDTTAYRGYSADVNGIYFLEGYFSSGGSQTQNNDYAIPCEIYGIR